MSGHLKRLNAPRSLRLHRKERVWTVRSAPGPHSKQSAIPLGLLIRDYLHLCDSLGEAKRLLSNGEILVDNTIQKQYRFPVGLMDVVSIPKLKKHYRVLFDKRGKLALVSLQAAEASWKLRKITGKTIVKENRTQLSFHDGFTMLVKKDTYQTGDVLKISFEKNKVEATYSQKKGTISLITGGSHIGELASIESIEEIKSSKPNVARMKGDHAFITLQDYVFAVGETKPVIHIPEVSVNE
ncbi:MAG: 30S ribosomal protein S4e [Thermoplasmatota archaeon]